MVRRLCDLGYVEAKRGPQGGVRFLPATREVTVGEVVRNLEPQVLVECFDAKTNTCPITAFCGLAGLLRRASTAFFRELDQVRVGELGAGPSGLRATSRPPRAPAARKATRSRRER